MLPLDVGEGGRIRLTTPFKKPHRRDNPYVRGDEEGQFRKAVGVGRLLAADHGRHA